MASSSSSSFIPLRWPKLILGNTWVFVLRSLHLVPVCLSVHAYAEAINRKRASEIGFGARTHARKETLCTDSRDFKIRSCQIECRCWLGELSFVGRNLGSSWIVYSIQSWLSLYSCQNEYSPSPIPILISVFCTYGDGMIDGSSSFPL